MLDINYITTNPLQRDKVLEAAIESVAPQFHTLATLPAPTSFIGTALVTDVGPRGTLFRSDGNEWGVVGGQCVLLHKTTPAPTTALTGSTAETVLDEFLIPGGLLGPNGGLIVFHKITTTNSANTKTLRVRLGGLAGTTVTDPQWTTNATITNTTWIENTGSVSSQIGSNGNPLGSGSSNSWRTAAINTNNNFLLTITGQLANAADSFQLITTRIVLVRP